jgi:hypothetical protein
MKFNLNKRMIGFVSKPYFFEKEKLNIKNNTVRAMNEEQVTWIKRNLNYIKYIAIVSRNNSDDVFQRKLRDIEFLESRIYNEKGEKVTIVIFTW